MNPRVEAKNLITLFMAGCVLLMIGAGLAMVFDWQPGNQDAISRAYKARQSVLTEVAAQ